MAHLVTLAHVFQHCLLVLGLAGVLYLGSRVILFKVILYFCSTVNYLVPAVLHSIPAILDVVSAI